MVSKTKFPGICNNCGKKSEFYIRCGIHTLQVCGTCAVTLGSELKMAVQAKGRDKMEKEYNNSVETGLIPMRKRQCSPQMIAEADCDNDPYCRKCWTDTGKVPPTGGVV